MLLALDRMETTVIVKGYTIKDKFATKIFSTNELHPLLFKKYVVESPWNEDIIDSSYPMSYWDGYKSLQQRIHTHIKNDPLLKQYKNEIRQFHDL